MDKPRPSSNPKILIGLILSLVLFWLLALVYSRIQSHIEEEPVAPLDWIRDTGGVVFRRVPIHVRDRQFHFVGFNASGQLIAETMDDELFPTDVILVFDEGMEAPQVFLARSPHGGCLVKWDEEAKKFADPCTGSQFTQEGQYLSGPSPRNLDELPSEVRDGVLWITGEIIYGD